MTDEQVAALVQASLVRDEIYKEIESRRHYQDQKYGGPENDDNLDAENWWSLIDDYNCNADYWDAMDDPGKWRKNMLDVAALAVAAIESFDRKKNAV